MSSVIAGIYEIQDQIGAGGGGIVYMGRHMRLDKKIVLKADKRKLGTKPEVLRREVDMLKDLSHTYIPQVYDFVQEDGVVYTVMDFIDGESLDRILKRGEVPSQPQVIHWACQILEALVYLHGQPPYGILHGDIKPANIMLKPNGDICLIDYNIALALGENGAVKTGFSRGYASPEHYGIEYADKGRRISTATKNLTNTKDDVTEVAGGDDVTESADSLSQASSGKNTGVTGNTGSTGSTGSGGGVLLDVRSDIYSLGATLYHLVSGKRPAQDALQVEPLGPEVCSPQVSQILQKAMASNPDMRYQTAAQMLTAFRDLHKNDNRVRRRKKREAIWTAALSVLFLCGGASTFVGMKRMEQTQEALTLAEYSANSLADGDVSTAISQALKAIPTRESILEAPPTAQAQKALTDALGVYDLSDGFKSLDSLVIPSAPFTACLSPDGSKAAAVYQWEVAVFDTGTGAKLASLPSLNSALSDAVFADNSRLVYAGDQGVTAYDLDKQAVLWTGEEATTLSLSADKTTVAAVNRDADYGVIYQMEDGKEKVRCSFEGHHMEVAANDIFANPGNRIFALNGDGTLLAVSFYEGELLIFDLTNPDNNLIVYEESEYQDFGGGFSGDYFAFVANKSDESTFGLVDAKEGAYVGAMDSRDKFLIEAGEEGIFLASQNVLVRFDPDTLEETELAFTNDKNIIGFSVGDSHVIVATDDNGFSFFDQAANLMSSEICQEPCDFTDIAGEYGLTANRSEPSVRLMKLESHSDAEIMSYDPRYLHDEARISQDQKTVMLFDYKGFSIYDREGNNLVQTELPDPETVYDQQFRKEEDCSFLEVIWYDGTVRRYSASDGSLLSETEGEPPEKDLYEEFFTKYYKIGSPLHGTPEVYDLKTGKKVAELEKDSYLTYVTQLGDYVVTEYISAAGQRYGLLLNERLETLAYLPDLCDIAGDQLVFDYGSGNLRQCRLYSLQELISLGETYLQKDEGRDETK